MYSNSTTNTSEPLVYDKARPSLLSTIKGKITNALFSWKGKMHKRQYDYIPLNARSSVDVECTHIENDLFDKQVSDLVHDEYMTTGDEFDGYIASDSSTNRDLFQSVSVYPVIENQQHNEQAMFDIDYTSNPYYPFAENNVEHFAEGDPFVAHLTRSIFSSEYNDTDTQEPNN